jgi:hypothetical protein
VFNSSPFIKIHRPTVVITTDACTQGGGMTCDFPSGPPDWGYMNWNLDYPIAKSMHINVKETLTAIFAIYRWAPQLRHCRVHLHTDNITTRATINKGASRHSEFIMLHLKHLFWICTFFDIEIDCVYLPGALNISSDAISRLHQPGHLLYWASQIHPMIPFDPLVFAAHSLGHMSPNSLLFIMSQVPRQPCLQNWMLQSHSSAARPLQSTPREATPLISTAI